MSDRVTESASRDVDSGMSLFGAAFDGSLAGLASRYTGQALMKHSAELSAKFGEGPVITNLTNTVGEHLSKQAESARLALAKPGTAAGFAKQAASTVAETTTNFGPKADQWLSRGLKATAESTWVAPAWKKAALTGAGVGLADYAVNKTLGYLTGMDKVFNPNWVETSAVTLAAMSPLKGQWKLAAIGTGWALGRVYDIFT